MVILYRPFEKTYRAPFLGVKNPKKGFLYGLLTPEDGIRKLSLNVGKELPLLAV